MNVESLGYSLSALLFFKTSITFSAGAFSHHGSSIPVCTVSCVYHQLLSKSLRNNNITSRDALTSHLPPCLHQSHLCPPHYSVRQSSPPPPAPRHHHHASIQQSHPSLLVSIFSVVFRFFFFLCQPTSNQRKCGVSDYVRGSQGWLARSSKQAQHYTLTNVIFRKAESGKRSSRPDVKFWLAIMARLPQKPHHLRHNADTKFDFALSAQQVRVLVVTLERVIND